MDAADADLVAFLNEEEEKENNQVNTKTSLNDLLSITDAAVEALDKTDKRINGEGMRPLSSVQPVVPLFNSLSPTHLRDLYDYGDPKQEWSNERGADMCPGVLSKSEVTETSKCQNDSMGSRSSTASEILIRSTTQTPREKFHFQTAQEFEKGENLINYHDDGRGLLDGSVSSRMSIVSDGNLSNSGFITGQAKKVKLSSKKLKEIKSPFESFHNESPDQLRSTVCESAPELSLVEPPIIDINTSKSDDKMSKKPKNSKQNKVASKVTNEKTPNGKPASGSGITPIYPKVGGKVVVECHVTDAMSTSLPKQKPVIREKAHIEKGQNSEQQIYRDLVITDHPAYFRSETLDESQTSSKKSFNPDLMATTSSKINAETASNLSSKKSFGFTDTGSMFIEDVIAGAVTDTSETPSMHSEDDAFHNPDIMTIPQSVVTITAQDGMNGINTSGSETSVENYPQALQDRFGKYRPSGVLRQGAPVDGPDPQNAPHTGDSDVTITHYNLSDKHRQMRSKFMKRNQNHGPVKRVVQPKVIPTATVLSSNQPSTSSIVDPVTTAAVAASAAVAATQPFLQAQHEVEHRMAEILEKLSCLQSAGSLTGGGVEGLGSTGASAVTAATSTGSLSTAGAAGEKILYLEDQLKDLTQRRLDYLEKMHEQQMMVQAQLLSISRQPGPTSVEQDSNWPAESRWKPASVTRAKHSPSKNEEADKIRGKDRGKSEKGVSVLDTPAPRKKQPTPMSIDSSDMKTPPRSPHRSKSKSPSRRKEKSPVREKKKAYGLLEEILSSQDETPRYPPFASTPPASFQSARSKSRVDVSPSAIRHANELVGELRDLKQEMRNAVVDAMQWKVPNQHDMPIDMAGNKSITGFETFTPGPYPLDDYLKSTADVTTSPYPKLRRGAGKSGNAPVIASYADAEESLQKIMASRAYLHDNLDIILRHHNDTEVVHFIEDLTRDASASERFRIKKMVDDLIAGMNTELEKEIMEEMLKVENKAQNRSVMIPERDTNSKSTKTGRAGTKFNRSNVGSRIDTGLKKGGKPTAEIPSKKPKVFTGARTPPKSVAFTARPKPVAKKKAMESETYLTRVYGKSLYHNSRNTQRDPKIRYNAASPSSKLAHSPSRISNKKAQGKDATDATSRGKVEHYFFNPSNRGQQPPANVASGVTHALGMQGELIPMAIPLGAPRQKTGAPPAPISSVPSTPNLPGSSPFASTPLEGHQTPRPQVSVHTEDDSMARSEAEEKAVSLESPRKSPRKARDQALSPIRLPSREASVSSETATTAVHQVSAPSKPDEAPVLTEQDEEPEVDDEKSHDGEGYEDDFEASDDDTITESQEEGALDIPGFSKPPPGPHHGPKFPPQAPKLNPGNSSDVLGSDLKRRDILSNHAMEWVEQELLARMLSEIAERKALEEALHAPPPVDIKPRVARPPHSPNDSEYSSDESLIPSAREPLIAESIGREGLQMFVNAGVAVDDRLVNNLIQEVIMEKISTMVGQHGSQDERREPPRRASSQEERPAPRPRSRPSSPLKQSSSLDNQLPPARKSPIPTPEPTPRSSPILSPRRDRASPPPTPDLTPAASLSDSLPVQPPAPAMPKQTERVSSERETVPKQIERQPHIDLQDSTEDSDTIEEYVPVHFNSRGRDDVSPNFVPRHDVQTPSLTPVQSPQGSLAYTPDASVEEPAPADKQPEQIRTETRDTGVMTNLVKIVRDYELDSSEVVAHRTTETQTIEIKPAAPEPLPPVKEPTPPLSPQLSYPDDIHEEQMPHEEVPKKPETIGTQTSRRSPSPSLSNTQEESTLSSVVSYDEAISEGEWLLTLHSEGEVRPVPLTPLAGHGITPVRVRRDDTLHDADDVDFDHEGREEMSADFEPSEGEILHDSMVPPEQDPMLAYLYQIHNKPMQIIEEQLRMNQFAAAGGAHVNPYSYPPVNKSLGEVSFGVPQPHTMHRPYPSPQPRPQLVRPEARGPAPKSILVQPGRGAGPSGRAAQSLESQSVGEVPSPGLVDDNGTSADSISDIQDYPVVNPVVTEPPGSSKDDKENGTPSVHQNMIKGSQDFDKTVEVAGDTPPDGNVNDIENPLENSPNLAVTSPGGEQLNESLGMTAASVSSARDAPMRLAEARKSGMLGGPIVSTENVSRSGRRVPRPGTSRGRYSHGRPATPDEGNARLMNYRTSHDSDLRDTLESVDGFKSTGGSDFRTMTPDQMNVDALLQSGQYLNQTVSSDGASTTDFGRTGDFGTVRSTEFSRTTNEAEDQDEYDTRGEYTRHLRSSNLAHSKSYDSASYDAPDRSGHFSQRSGHYGTHSGEFATRSREEVPDRSGVRMSGTLGRLGRMTYTTSEFAHSESEFRYSGRFSEDSENQRELQASGHYPDSLEGTGELSYTGALRKTYGDNDVMSGSDHSPASRSGPIQVSVTIPSMAQSDSATDDGGSASAEDVSEISLGK